MNLPSLSELFISFRNAFVRFPLSVLFALLCCFLSVYMIEYDINEKSPVFKLLTASIIGVPLMISARIFSERFNRNGISKYIAYASGLAVLALYIIFIAPDFESSKVVRPIRFTSVLIFSHLLVSVAPYLRIGQVEDFWEYNKQIFVNWISGALYGIVMFLGCSVALLAVDNLFGVNIRGDLYLEIFVIIASVFHPIYFLANFPENFHRISENEKYSAIILNVVKYILIPLSLLYIVILYLFAVKIGIEATLPKGWLASLVLSFSITGMLTYLLNYQLPAIYPDGNVLLKWFKKWFFVLMLPLVVLLYIAIIRRVSDYGFTPPRYFVMLAAVWLSWILAYFIISRKRKIKLIPMSLIGFLAIGSLSPVDAFQVSTRSQYKRFIRIFEEKNLVRDGIISIDTTVTALNAKEQERTGTILQVLDAMNSLDKINEHLPVRINEDSLESNKGREKLMRALGIKDAAHLIQPEAFHNYYAAVHEPANIEGYKHLRMMSVFKGVDATAGFELSDDQRTIYWKENQQLKATLEMKEILQTLSKKYSSDNSGIQPDSLCFNFDSPKYNIRLCIQQLGTESIGGEVRINTLEALFLYSEK